MYESFGLYAAEDEPELYSGLRIKSHSTHSSHLSTLGITMKSEKTMSEKEMVSTTSDKHNFLSIYDSITQL